MTTAPVSGGQLYKEYANGSSFESVKPPTKRSYCAAPRWQFSFMLLDNNQQMTNV
jgi:hypothetical protein